MKWDHWLWKLIRFTRWKGVRSKSKLSLFFLFSVYIIFFPFFWSLIEWMKQRHKTQINTSPKLGRALPPYSLLHAQRKMTILIIKNCLKFLSFWLSFIARSILHNQPVLGHFFSADSSTNDVSGIYIAWKRRQYVMKRSRVVDRIFFSNTELRKVAELKIPRIMQR